MDGNHDPLARYTSREHPVKLSGCDLCMACIFLNALFLPGTNSIGILSENGKMSRDILIDKVEDLIHNRRKEISCNNGFRPMSFLPETMEEAD